MEELLLRSNIPVISLSKLFSNSVPLLKFIFGWEGDSINSLKTVIGIFA